MSPRLQVHFTSKLRITFRLHLCVALAANALLLVRHPCAQARETIEPGPQTVLGIQGTRFTLNGQPTFLLGISYFGSLGAPEEFIRRDLEDMPHHGFNMLRVWATWSAFGRDVSAVDSQGAAREPFLRKLQWLIAECDRRGLVVDVTLTRKQASSETAIGAGLVDFHSHERALETLINALKKYYNWYLDLANEHDVRDARYVSPSELKKLMEIAYQLDPQLLVTASYGGHDLTESDVRDSLINIGNNFLSPHRPRDSKSPSQTEAQTRACLALMKAAQRVAPVIYQEPFRRGYNSWEPTVDDFLTDLHGAVAGGAAGWCFHNGPARSSPDGEPRRSFDLHSKRLFDQLDPEEQQVVLRVKGEIPSQASHADFGGLGAAGTDTDYFPIKGPLRASKNPNYFQDADGIPLILCGSHTWNTLQDWGTDGAIQTLDFDAFVRFLKGHGHNFTLLWCTELPKFHGLPSTDTSPPDFTVSPHPWMRTGPGTARDGRLKFDLTRYDPAYFDRLRARVEVLNRAGIYAAVYLFTGEFLLRFRCPTDGYPFSGSNNINGVDDGYRDGSAATAVSAVTMTGPNAITGFQDAYVRKTIDILNDLPNVLWIVSEEAPSQSLWWNNHLISLIRSYESGKHFQHPIGYATIENPSDSLLYDSDADWVAPWAWTSPITSCGSGKPACKVNVNDSDHSYFGMWNDPPLKNRNYAWLNFMNGNQVAFMDPYLVYYPRQNRNLCLAPVHGIGTGPDVRWDNFRNNLGYILRYSRKLNLANVLPRSSLSSTKCCLAQTPSVGAEYLVYAPSGGSFTLDLSAMPPSRMLSVEWFNPATGETTSEGPIAAGDNTQSFTTPFSGDAVLYLVDKLGHR